MTTIVLSGYPEAVLGRSSITVPLPSGAVLADAVSAVAAQHNKLGPALLHTDSRPRRSTKALLNGAVADLATPIPARASVTVLATLPCDG
ncbi:MAG: MoaD/ThiS family protein [Sciscionella sp.]